MKPLGDLDGLPRRYGDSEDDAASEPLGRVVYCAPRRFLSGFHPGGNPYEHGIISLDTRLLSEDPPELTSSGTQLEPHAMAASLELPDVSLSLGVDHFGRVEQLLIEDGERVMPGQPLFVFDERAPTTAEYGAQWEKRYRAEGALRELHGRGPLKAFWDAVRARV